MYLFVLKTHELYEYTDYSKLNKFANNESLFVAFYINKLTCDELFSFIYYLKINQIPYILNDHGYLHMSEGFNANDDYKKLNLKTIDVAKWFSKQLDLYQNYKLYQLI